MALEIEFQLAKWNSRIAELCQQKVWRISWYPTSSAMKSNSELNFLTNWILPKFPAPTSCGTVRTAPAKEKTLASQMAKFSDASQLVVPQFFQMASQEAAKKRFHRARLRFKSHACRSFIHSFPGHRVPPMETGSKKKRQRFPTQQQQQQQQRIDIGHFRSLAKWRPGKLLLPHNWHTRTSCDRMVGW